jgi:glycosyltransferase involved in cell wall biosynthesis
MQADLQRPLSVVIPCYNEAATLRKILRRVADSPVVHEIIVVDDGSRDGTRDILLGLERSWSPEDPPLRVILQPVNRGKGAALRAGFARARGELTIVQDADLEYDPREYRKLIQPILDGDADVVYGSRFAGFPRRVLYFWHSLGNRVLTLLSNMATNLNLTDMETCYKVFKTEILRTLPLRSDRFGFEPEITAKLAKLGCRFYEVPISYRGRSYAEGKKIGWRDGLQALGIILKYWMIDDLGVGQGEQTLRLLRKAGRYNRWVFDLVRPYLGKDLLEVGAGIGNMTRHFLGQGRITATDVNPYCLTELQRNFSDHDNVSVRRWDVEQGDFDGDRAYDTIVCLNVLEHLKDDLGALQRMKARLRPGGRLILYVPAGPRLYCGIDRGVGHHRRYERRGLEARIREAGFDLLHLRHHNPLGALGWWISGKVFGKRRVAAGDVGSFEALIPIARLLDGLESRFSLSILAVAERPREAADFPSAPPRKVTSPAYRL